VRADNRGLVESGGVLGLGGAVGGFGYGPKSALKGRTQAGSDMPPAGAWRGEGSEGITAFIGESGLKPLTMDKTFQAPKRLRGLVRGLMGGVGTP